MAHMIDETTGVAAIAYSGETPWHGLGQALSSDASIEEWTQQAGLNWMVERSQVGYRLKGSEIWTPCKDRDVLYRNDTGASLGVVSQNYKVVQPAEVMAFFDELTKINGFQMETAGALSDGKRIWALAKVNDGASIIGHDIVRPYLLLTTSYDGSTATTAKLTAIRVVCNNTLAVSLHSEGATTGRVVNSMVKVAHSGKFIASQVRKEMGIFEGDFDKWMIQTRLMAEQEINLDSAGKMTAALIGTIQAVPKDGRVVDVTKSKGYSRVMELFDGEAIGSDLAQGFTKWQWINSVTQWVDHERGRNQDSRLNSAWFGAGEKIKAKAYEIASA